MACANFLEFELTQNPPWRKRITETTDAPSISDMILEIVSYRSKYIKIKTELKLNTKEIKRIDRDFLLLSLLNLQREEGIGLQNEEDTKRVLNIIEKEAPDIGIEKVINKLKPDDRRQMRHNSNDRSRPSSGERSACKRQTSGGSSSSQNSDHGDDSKRQKLEEGDVYFDPPYFPSLGGTEFDIQKTFKESTKKPFKDLRETINLYRAYKCLASQIDEINKDERNLILGFIEIDTCILKVHRILMENLMDDEATKPGTFSCNVRTTGSGDKAFTYPRYATEELACTAVQSLIDKYHDMIEEIRQLPDDPGDLKEKIERSFKCASLFLFAFLTLHPFGDGNGRLGRLLCSYSLFTFSPFLTPIFNVFSPSQNDDYVEALVKGRQNLKFPEVITTDEEAHRLVLSLLQQKPADLCAMVIESNRYMWKEYISRLSQH